MKGNYPEGWQSVRIGDVCTLMTGGTPSRSKPEYFDGDIRWLVSGDIHQREITKCSGRISQLGMDNSNAKLLPVNSVIIALNGQGKTRGTVAMLRAVATCNQSLVSIMPKDTNVLLPEFVYTNLRGRYEEIRRMTGDDGNDRRGLNMRLIRNISIPLPPLEEQQRIVAVLDAAFEGLARARAHASANLQNARELFERELEQVFSEGKEGWKRDNIGDLCAIKSGTTVPKSLENPEGDVPYVKVAAMNLVENLDGIVTSSRFLKNDDISQRQIIPVGATIFPKRGGAILTNKKRIVLVDICADLNVMGVIPGPKLDAEFLHFFFLSVDMRQIGSGTTIPQINNYDINPLELSFPPKLTEQRRIAKALQSLKDQTVALSNAYAIKLQDLDDLRQSLLQKAFAGELT